MLAPLFKKLKEETMLNVFKLMLQTSLIVEDSLLIFPSLIDCLTHLNSHSTMICPLISIIWVGGIIQILGGITHKKNNNLFVPYQSQNIGARKPSYHHPHQQQQQ